MEVIFAFSLSHMIHFSLMNHFYRLILIFKAKPPLVGVSASHQYVNFREYPHISRQRLFIKKK